MGFLDKAKQLADQAQQKIDEVQTNFNESQQAKQSGAGGSGAGPITEYDKHGRPLDRTEPVAAAGSRPAGRRGPAASGSLRAGPAGRRAPGAPGPRGRRAASRPRGLRRRRASAPAAPSEERDQHAPPPIERRRDPLLG